MKIADIFEKIKPALKKYWWYIILLIMSSVYVFVNWNDINKLNSKIKKCKNFALLNSPESR